MYRMCKPEEVLARQRSLHRQRDQPLRSYDPATMVKYHMQRDIMLKWAREWDKVMECMIVIIIIIILHQR